MKILKTLNVVALVFVCFCSFAQLPGPNEFNTATNAAFTGTLPIGTNDLHWMASMTSSVGPFVSAVSAGHPYPLSVGWHNSTIPNANWISYPHTCITGEPGRTDCLQSNLDIFYKLTFNLPATTPCGAAITTPSAYCLAMDYYADNTVYAVYLNGSLAYQNPSANPYYEMDFFTGNNKTITLCNNWQSGANSIVVHVKSGNAANPTWEGFFAEINNSLVTSSAGAAAVTQTNVTCFGGSTGAASVTASGGNGPYTYTWIPNVGNSNLVSGLPAGNYTVKVAWSGTCLSTSTINITQPAAINLTVTGNNTVKCSGTKVTFSVSGASTYSWLPGNIAGSSATFAPMSNTTYTVIGKDPNGCTVSKTFTQTVSNCEGLSELNYLNQISLFPNPTKDVITAGNLEPATIIRVYNLIGEMLSVEKASDEKFLIDLSKYCSGIYFIKFSVGNESITRKVVKE